MTLAMALRAIDGLVLATDSRVTSAEGTADTSEKFVQVNRDTGALTYGLARPGYRGITELVNAVGARKLAKLSSIHDAAVEVFQRAYEEWRKERTEDVTAGLVGYIVAGYDSVDTNQFQIRHYELVEHAGGGINFEQHSPLPGDLLAGQWQIARYLLSRLQYGEMTVGELSELAVFILAETMAVEETVGGPMQLATVTISEGFQRIYEKEVLARIRENQFRVRRVNELIKRQFLLGFEAMEAGHAAGIPKS